MSSGVAPGFPRASSARICQSATRSPRPGQPFVQSVGIWRTSSAHQQAPALPPAPRKTRRGTRRPWRFRGRGHRSRVRFLPGAGVPGPWPWRDVPHPGGRCPVVVCGAVPTVAVKRPCDSFRRPDPGGRRAEMLASHRCGWCEAQSSVQSSDLGGSIGARPILARGQMHIASVGRGPAPVFPCRVNSPGGGGGLRPPLKGCWARSRMENNVHGQRSVTIRAENPRCRAPVGSAPWPDRVRRPVPHHADGRLTVRIVR